MSISKIKKAISQLSQNEITSLEEKYKDLDYLDGLNDQQKIAATRMAGNFLVIAGPGTGKTHTLVYRVIHMLKEGIDPKSIVIITFTRRAATELKARVNRLIPNTSLGFVGTFHSFSNHISNIVGSSSPISKFRLLDTEDDLQVHKLVMANFKNFNTKMRAKTLQKTLSFCANTKQSVEDYITSFDLHKLRDDIDNIEDYQGAYEDYKASHMLANYDDMIDLMASFLKRTGSKTYIKDFDYLMIDEYQDTNQMQLDFVKTLDIKNVMAIGDDFQGIYSFRGADHRIILDFYNDYQDGQMIKLVKNYRSNDGIVNWVNDTVARSNLGYHKQLKSAKGPGGAASLVSGASLNEHKQLILDQIDRHPQKTHALIYRYNKNRTVFEKAFIEKKIDYTVYGGIRLLERRHIKDVLAFLMTYLNRRDVVSYNRILTLVPGIGPKSSRRMIDTDMKDLTSFGGQKGQYLHQIKTILSMKVKKETLYKMVCDFYFTLYDQIGSEFYTKEEIQEDFKLVGDLLGEYDSLHNFIVNLILDPVIDMHKGKNPKVILTTIHSSKGLEFDYVYYFHTHDWYKNYDVESLEEDRRLFYVGISRAKDHLFVFDHSEIKRDFNQILSDFDNAYARPVEDITVVKENSDEKTIDTSANENQLSADEEIKKLKETMEKMKAENEILRKAMEILTNK
jgi:DNA helicase-2/ATP-dependent DNA helicase PcrA